MGSCPAKNLDRINPSESEQLTKKGHGRCTKNNAWTSY